MESAPSLDSAMNILSQSVSVDQNQQPAAQVNNNPISPAVAVAPLKDEFHSILTTHTTLPLNSSSMVPSTTDSTISTYELPDECFTAYDRLSTEVIPDLRRIAEEMNSAGHLRDCVDVYRCVRKPFVDTHFRTLGIDNFTARDARKIQLEDLKKKIDLWIGAARFCIRVLFRREKKVYEQIFGGIGTATYEACFIATVKDAANLLFSFADALSSTSPRHANKLFMVLDLYNALSDLSSDIGVLFPPESARIIPIDTQKQLSQLKELVLRTLLDFENSLVDDQSTISTPAGAIPHLTKFVMNYVSRIKEYKKILCQLIVSNPSTSFRDPEIPDMEFVKQEGQTTPLGLHLILIIVVLSFNLVVKFKNYIVQNPSLVLAPDGRRTDSPLFHLFMMNNLHYIVQHIKGYPGLKEIVGDNYLNRLTEKVGLEMNSSQKLICDRLLYCLRDEGLRRSTWVSSGVSKVRERIRMFNARLEEVQRDRSTWVVPDVQLRDELCQSISAELVPAYDSFLKQYGRDIKKRRHPNIIKYSVDELGTFISTSFFSKG